MVSGPVLLREPRTDRGSVTVGRFKEKEQEEKEEEEKGEEEYGVNSFFNNTPGRALC